MVELAKQAELLRRRMSRGQMEALATAHGIPAHAGMRTEVFLQRLVELLPDDPTLW